MALTDSSVQTSVLVIACTDSNGQESTIRLNEPANTPANISLASLQSALSTFQSSMQAIGGSYNSRYGYPIVSFDSAQVVHTLVVKETIGA